MNRNELIAEIGALYESVRVTMLDTEDVLAKLMTMREGLKQIAEKFDRDMRRFGDEYKRGPAAEAAYCAEACRRVIRGQEPWEQG